MSFADSALAATKKILVALGDDGISLYPVPANGIDTFLAEGGVAVDLTGKGVMDFDDVRDEQGEVFIDNVDVVLRTDDDTVNNNSIAKGKTSIEFKSVRYDLARQPVPETPGAYNIYLRRFLT